MSVIGTGGNTAAIPVGQQLILRDRFPISFVYRQRLCVIKVRRSALAGYVVFVLIPKNSHIVTTL